MYRIGQSSDIHRLVKGLPLYLGGVRIQHDSGLLGHSDADCLLHAIAEAIIGAMGKGDLGGFFPDNDPKYKGIDSKLILKEVGAMMQAEGYVIENIDSLIMIEEPKMAPYINEMSSNIAACLNIDVSLVNVKATRGEGLGFVGKLEGVMAQAIILLKKSL